MENNDNATQHRLPLGLIKQASMKLDSFISDMYEIREDPDLDPEEKETLRQMTEMGSIMQATLINMVKREIDEDDFLNESVNMDDIDLFPGSSDNLLDASL